MLDQRHLNLMIMNINNCIVFLIGYSIDIIERERCIDTSNDELDESLSTSMSLDHDTTVSMPDLGNLIQFSNHAIEKFFLILALLSY